MSEILYSPGAWRAVVAPGGIAVLPPAVDAALLGRIRAALDSGDGLGAVLSSLAEAFGGGFSALPPFAVVAFGDGESRLAVRGEVSVSISEDSGPVVVSGAGVSTWSERAVPSAAGFVVSTPEASAGGERFAIVSGVVLVSEVAVASGAAIASPPAAAPTAVVAPAPEAAPEVAPAPSAAPAPEVAPEPAAAPEAEPEPAPEPAPVPDVELTQDVASELENSQAEELESTQAELPDDAYDHLWGATVVKSVEDAAVRELDDEEAEGESAAAPATPPAPAPAPQTPAPAPAPLTPPPAPTAAPAVPGTGLIDSVPGFGSVGAASGSPALLGTTVPPAAPSQPQTPAAPAPLATPAASQADDDHDGLTVTVSELEAMRRLADAAPAAAELPADALGRIVLSTGESYPLDRPVIIGRRPRANRVQADAVPVLVTVASPEQDISRNHLEIRLEGRHVLAVDLATTNGSVLHREGTPPKRLGPNEPELVLSGDVIDLGDGVTVAFEEIP
ncbi:FHA domain-containing protein [Herbiconiux sp. VKM Ac-1786]|uniref:FHA domain-containing protein n=1 Tax=Herbiconiux sp. VKM Ac-1786 TaxID=2783824 RepID=UPI00188AA343|nr:FHA domain-containing protein [Herbiconiux sp. VKM Ac-1786]MBF4572079.1 FHA domain-containing protein [Herbiconiux sp. VKM Ac-1786]